MAFATCQESVEPMSTLFEVLCSLPTILAVLAMSRKIFNRSCLEHPLTHIRIVGNITRVGLKVAGGLQVGDLAGVGAQIGCELSPL